MDEDSANRRERELLERLLDAGDNDDPESFLQEVLAVAVERTGALRGYLALLTDDDVGRPRWWRAIDCDEQQITHIEQATSSGVVAEALTTGKTLRIINAMLDPAWSQHASIRRNQVEAVVCCPLGQAPPAGVLLLQGRPGGGPFRDDDVARAEKLARWITPMARRHLAARADPTVALRKRLDVADLVGGSALMNELLQQIELAARFDLDVLLLGPTGGGKSAVARAISRNSSRRDRPFIEVNCGGLQDSLVETELFGAVPGSYTGAPNKGLSGLVESAEGGVLFLDEVGELSAAAQRALLLFLDTDKRYRKVGSSQTLSANVRVLAATNRNLQAEVDAGRFRLDLFHRLAAMTIRVPGLDERREDVPAIADRVLHDLARRHHLAVCTLTPAALHALQSADWPGHIRQLTNVLRMALVRANHAHVPRIGLGELYPERAGTPEVAETYQEATRRFQCALLRQVLDEVDWNVAEACERLDLSRSRLYELISACGHKRQ